MWATEFESNLSQMEKDAKESFEREKQELQAKLERARPGNLCVTVSNHQEADDATYRVSLDGVHGRIVEGEEVVGRGTWTRLSVAAGAYSILITARYGGRTASAMKVFEVPPGKTQSETMTLVVARAAGSQG